MWKARRVCEGIQPSTFVSSRRFSSRPSIGTVINVIISDYRPKDHYNFMCSFIPASGEFTFSLPDHQFPWLFYFKHSTMFFSLFLPSCLESQTAEFSIINTFSIEFLPTGNLQKYLMRHEKWKILSNKCFPEMMFLFSFSLFPLVQLWP